MDRIFLFVVYQLHIDFQGFIAMELLTDYLFSLPMVVFTIPAIILILVWLFTLLGLLDIEIFDITSEADTAIETDGAAGGNWLSSLGLDGVPLTVAITFLDIYGLAASYMARKYLMPMLEGILTATAAGASLALASLLIAIPVSAICIRPLRRFFATHEGAKKHDLIGTFCVVKTQSVTESFGQAVALNGMVFSVRSKTPNDIKQGVSVALLEYDSSSDVYWVVSEQELLAMSSQPHL